MTDMKTQLRRYLEDTPDVTFDEIVAAAAEQRDVGVVPSRHARVRRGSLVALAAAAATLLLGVLVTLPFRDTTERDRTGSGTEATRTILDETTARNMGQPYDPQLHDLCVWLRPEEIDAIVTNAYLDHGAEPPPGTFTMEDKELGGIGCTWYTEADGIRLGGEEFSLVAMEFQDGDRLVLIPYQSRETGTPFDEPDEFVLYGRTGGVRIGNLSRGVWGYIQGVHASFTVDEHPEVVEFLHWAPHHSTERAGPINPIGLAIADELLHRIGWVEDRTGADGGTP